MICALIHVLRTWAHFLNFLPVRNVKNHGTKQHQLEGNNSLNVNSITYHSGLNCKHSGGALRPPRRCAIDHKKQRGFLRSLRETVTASRNGRIYIMAPLTWTLFVQGRSKTKIWSYSCPSTEHNSIKVSSLTAGFTFG